MSAPAATPGLREHALQWAFGPGDPRQLAALRIGLCSLLALRLAARAEIHLELAGQQPELYRPLSYMALFDRMPPRELIVACLVAGILAAVLAAAGLFARTMLAVALVAALLLGGMYTAQGKVMHNDALLVLCLIAIVFSRHGDAWSLDALRRSRRRSGMPWRAEPGPAYGWPVRTAMIVVALAYLLAGLHKIAGSGGLGWASSENMRWVLYVASDQQGYNAVAFWIAEHPWAAHLSASVVLATECLFWLTLLAPRLRWVLVPAAVAFHAGTWVTLGLDYSAWALCVVIVFVSWPAATHRAREWATWPMRSGAARI